MLSQIREHLDPKGYDKIYNLGSSKMIAVVPKEHSSIKRIQHNKD